MKNISKVLSIILLLTFSVVINQCASNQKTDIKPLSFTEEVPKIINEIYLKDGKVIQCDIVWEGIESQIMCKKSEDILAYSTDNVDLVKTFGETDAKEIAKGYEKIKGREESTKILKSIGTQTGYVGGGTSYTANGIEVSNFGVTTKSGGKFHREWVFSCVIKNLTSVPKSVSVTLSGVDSNGYEVKGSSIGSGKIWPGEYKMRSRSTYYGREDKRITKWEIIKIRSFK